MNSILPPDFSGTMFIGGRRGSGKSFLASQADNPKYLCFIDYEEKGTGIHHQLNFGEYHSVLPDANLYQNTLNIIDNLEQDKFTVAIFDNVSHLEDAMKAEAKNNAATYANLFGLNQGNIVAGRYGGTSAVVNKLISYKISAPIHKKGVKLIIGTAHTKPFWAGGIPIPNKWNILGADRWQDLAILSLILVNSEDKPTIPAAIVKKEQLGQIRFDAETGEFTIGRRLPFRIPQCTFKAIREYLDHPADLDNPAKGEVVSKAEYAAYSDELTNEQLEMNKAALTIQQEEIKRQETEVQNFLDSQYDEVKALVKGLATEFAGYPAQIAAGKILTKVQEKYPGYNQEDVRGMIE